MCEPVTQLHPPPRNGNEKSLVMVRIRCVAQQRLVALRRSWPFNVARQWQGMAFWGGVRPPSPLPADKAPLFLQRGQQRPPPPPPPPQGAPCPQASSALKGSQVYVLSALKAPLGDRSRSFFVFVRLLQRILRRAHNALH